MLLVHWQHLSASCIQKEFLIEGFVVLAANLCNSNKFWGFLTIMSYYSLLTVLTECSNRHSVLLFFLFFLTVDGISPASCSTLIVTLPCWWCSRNYTLEPYSVDGRPVYRKQDDRYPLIMRMRAFMCKWTVSYYLDSEPWTISPKTAATCDPTSRLAVSNGDVRCAP